MEKRDDIPRLRHSCFIWLVVPAVHLGQLVQSRPRGQSHFTLSDSVKRRLSYFGMAAGAGLGLLGRNNFSILGHDHAITIALLVGAVLSFFASFAVSDDFFQLSRGTPQWGRLIVRAGLSYFAALALVGLFELANGYGTPLLSRDVTIVGKHISVSTARGTRVYHYVTIRAWPPSRTVVELDVPRTVYNEIQAPTTNSSSQDELDDMTDSGTVRLLVGQGRFGVEWYKGLKLAE